MLSQGAAALALCHLAWEDPTRRWLILSLGLDGARVNESPRFPFPERCGLHGCLCAQNWLLKGSEFAGRCLSDMVPLRGAVEGAQRQKRSVTAAGLAFPGLGVYEDVSCIPNDGRHCSKPPQTHLKY